MTKVFISYRRDDASANAGRLCDWLKRQFREDNIFLDTEKIAPGDNFPQVLRERLATSNCSCEEASRRFSVHRRRSGGPTPVQ